MFENVVKPEFVTLKHEKGTKLAPYYGKRKNESNNNFIYSFHYFSHRK